MPLFAPRASQPACGTIRKQKSGFCFVCSEPVLTKLIGFYNQKKPQNRKEKEFEWRFARVQQVVIRLHRREQRRLQRHVHLQETPVSPSVSCVCPKPVLVKRIVLYFKTAQKRRRFFLPLPRRSPGAATRDYRGGPPSRRRRSSFECFPLPMFCPEPV